MTPAAHLPRHTACSVFDAPYLKTADILADPKIGGCYMATGKCPNPKCDKVPGYLLMEEVEALLAGTQKRFRAVSFLCSSCRTIISAGINPWMIKEETVAEIKS